MPLTKTDLIATVAGHTGSSSKDVATVLAGLEDVIVATVAKGEKVVITGFLTFDRSAQRRAQGPQPANGRDDQHQGLEEPEGLRWSIVQERCERKGPGAEDHQSQVVSNTSARAVPGDVLPVTARAASQS